MLPNKIFERPLTLRLLIILFVVTMSALFLPMRCSAVADQRNFSLQVTPSPLVATLRPNTSSTLELKVRNTGTTAEKLKIETRQFRINEADGKVLLDDTKSSEIADWIQFSAPLLSVQPGEWYTEKIQINLPEKTGFSYSFALVISRASNEKATEAGRLIRGSVAVFTLINVDRPGATRKLEVKKFTTSENVYEYLPATIETTFKNTGNTILQPYGNIFMQRGTDDSEPLGVIPVNEQKGYILPGSSRAISSTWSDGFPLFSVSTDSAGNTKKQELWNWPNLAKLRMGQYTAKLVGVYNDGVRDQPLEATTSFWVVPWKILLVGGLATLFIGIGLITVPVIIWRFFRKRKRK